MGKKIIRTIIIIPLFTLTSPIGMFIAWLFGSPLDWFRVMAEIIDWD